MAIIRVKKDKDNPYFMMNRTAMEDENLSFKSKGIFSYLMSKPDDWKCQVEDLKKHAKDGRDSIYAGLKELRKFGYLIKRPVKNNKGKIIAWEEILFETPQEEAKEVFKEQADATKQANLKRINTLKNDKNNNPLPENPEQGKNNEISTSGFSVSGFSVSGKPADIINNKLLNTDLPTNEISSSSREKQFEVLINLYSEHYGKITNGRKRKIYITTLLNLILTLNL